MAKRKKIKKNEPKKVKCPGCGKMIDYLVNIQSGTREFTMSVNRGRAEYEEIDWDQGDESSFECPECEYEISFWDEDEAIKFLQGKVK